MEINLLSGYHLKKGNSIQKGFKTFEDSKEYEKCVKDFSDTKFCIITNG
jgi:hypothetical protein